MDNWFVCLCVICVILICTAETTNFYPSSSVPVTPHLETSKKQRRKLFSMLNQHFCSVCLQSATSFLQYLDVSVGKEVAAICTKTGRLDVMCQNPHNAIIHLGHPNGTVTLWSPNQKEALVKMLCHQGGVRSVAVDKTGTWVTLWLLWCCTRLYCSSKQKKKLARNLL